MSVESDLEYLYSLGATKNVLSALSEDTKDDFVVIPLPFSELTSVATKSFSVSVVFGGNTVTLELRKDLSDNDWWITENGSVNGSNYSHIGRFTLNSFIHEHADFTYVIVSPYELDTTDEKMAVRCLANSSLLLKY